MTSSIFKTDDDFKKLDLRLMLFVVVCEEHKYQSEIWKTTSGINEDVDNLDFKIIQSQIIYEYIANSTFMNHSTIIIMINCSHFPCRAKTLRIVIKAIERNKYLRYKLKVICTFYENRPEFRIDNNVEFSFYREAFFTDYYSFTYSYLENTFLFQDCHARTGDLMINNLLKIVQCQPLIAVQELDLFLIKSCAILTLSKGNVALYFYSVNPALAIIINNYYFTNLNPICSIREGSEKDVLNLGHQFQISRTPYIVLQDSKQSEILKLVKFLQRTNLKSLKCLYIITMTHGAENNIVYTNDGKLNFIDDILEPIQSNILLNDTHITFVNVHCRGNFDGRYIDPNFSENISPTKIQQLQPNTSVFYSVPDSLVSPRERESGTPFISSFSKAYGELECSANTETLREKITNDLKNHHYYATLDCFGKSAELVVADPTKSHCIKPMPTSAAKTVSCFESIQKEFHDLFSKDTDNMLNMVEDDPNPTTTFSNATSSFCLFANENQSLLTELPKDPYLELDEDLESRILKLYTIETRIFEMYLQVSNYDYTKFKHFRKQLEETSIFPIHKKSDHGFDDIDSYLNGFAREYILEDMDEDLGEWCFEDVVEERERLQWFWLRVSAIFKRRFDRRRCRKISDYESF